MAAMQLDGTEQSDMQDIEEMHRESPHVGLYQIEGWRTARRDSTLLVAWLQQAGIAEKG